MGFGSDAPPRPRWVVGVWGSLSPLSIIRRVCTLRGGEKPRKRPISRKTPILAPPHDLGPKMASGGPRGPKNDHGRNGPPRLSLLTRPDFRPENPFIRSPPGGPGGPKSGFFAPPGGQGSPAGGPRGPGAPGAGGKRCRRHFLTRKPRKSPVPPVLSSSLVHAG